MGSFIFEGFKYSVKNLFCVVTSTEVCNTGQETLRFVSTNTVQKKQDRITGLAELKCIHSVYLKPQFCFAKQKQVNN